MNKLLVALLILVSFASCRLEDDGIDDYKQAMRDLVAGISGYANSIHPGFFVIPQNGIELVAKNGEENGQVDSAYLAVIDGNGQEDLWYGYHKDNEATPASEREYLQYFLDLSRNAGNVVFVTDYCSTQAKMDDSYASNHGSGYVSFAADQRELNNIPGYPVPIYQENKADVQSLSDVKNFLYLINPERFASKTDFIAAVTATNYDLLIMDLFFNDGSEFTAAEVGQLHHKSNSGKRLVIAYMSVGEAENYRYYWQSTWDSTPPVWMEKENPDWEGNFKVRYWNPDWQNILYGNDDSYLKKILDAGFDGVYLDIIDAYEYYE